jgi:hypothetical protein
MNAGKSYLAVTWCEAHEKLCYTSRKRARQIARRHPEHKSTFRCSVNENLWHIGTLPDPIKYGHIGKAEFFEKVANA